MYPELDGKLKEVFDFLSSVNQKAYNSIYLLSNIVLSKNPASNNFLNKFLKGEKASTQNIFTVVSRLFIYYFKNFVYFVIYLLFFSAFHLSGLRYSINPSLKKFMIIDTFFLIDRIQKKNKFEDSYFIGLKEVLDNLGKYYAYLPVFYKTKNPIKMFKIFKILKRDKEPVLTEYQLLTGMDLLKIFCFILVYPFKVLIFAKNIKEDTYLSGLLRSEIVDSLRCVSFFNFSRYLQGRRIAGLPCEKIKVISWFENQTIDKNLYKGLRECRHKTEIYGAQPFLYSKSGLNIFADENEAKFGIVPDKIVVNGLYFIPKFSTLNFIAGPSFRYKKLFEMEIDNSHKDNILVLLPYYMEDVCNIFNLLRGVNSACENIIVKVHPSVPLDKIKGLLPEKAKISDNNLYELFKTASVVLGAASGTLVESTSVGIPVIYVNNTERFDYNPLPDYGKGIIWDEADDSRDIERLIAKFRNSLKDKNELNKIKKIACDYRNMFFCEPTMDGIIKAYGLDE